MEKRASLPIPDPDSRPFWQACQEKRLVAQVCGGCGKLRLPPLPACPECHSRDYQWEELSGRGVVWSFTVIHHAFRPNLEDKVPYTVGLIVLDKGPRIVGKIHARNRTVNIGSRVRVRFEAIEGTHLPYFELEPESNLAS